MGDVKYMCSYGKALSEPAEPALLSSALEQPSNLFLQNALVKCGKRKQRGNFMEVGKVCTDENFTLESMPQVQMPALSSWDSGVERNQKKEREFHENAQVWP